MSAAPRALFAALVDDAALFPPGNAPMDVGLREHAQHRKASYGDLVGPFVCPVSRVTELVETLSPDEHLRVSLVVDVPGDAAHRALRELDVEARLTPVAVEAAAERLGASAAAIGANIRRMPGVVGYLETPREGWDGALDLVSESGWHAAKYRTGGVRDQDVPDPLHVSLFIAECIRRGIAFKLTAGLHHAVAAGFADEAAGGRRQHGVLNVLAAVDAAQAGASQDLIAGLLATDDAAALASDISRWSQARCTRVRSVFRSFGCCGVTDPIDDLAALGLIEEPRP
jgi:hypothetical protein